MLHLDNLLLVFQDGVCHPTDWRRCERTCDNPPFTFQDMFSRSTKKHKLAIPKRFSPRWKAALAATGVPPTRLRTS